MEGRCGEPIAKGEQGFDTRRALSIAPCPEGERQHYDGRENEQRYPVFVVENEGGQRACPANGREHKPRSQPHADPSVYQKKQPFEMHHRSPRFHDGGILAQFANGLDYYVERIFESGRSVSLEQVYLPLFFPSSLPAGCS